MDKNFSASSAKKVKYQSGHGNRLGGLIYHPQLIPQHKEMLESKMSAVNFTRRCVQYIGCGLFILHMIRNRIRLSKFTGVYVAVPPVLSYIIKIFGYFWIDNYAQRSGLYKLYKISTL